MPTVPDLTQPVRLPQMLSPREEIARRRNHLMARMESRRLLATVLSNTDWARFVSTIQMVIARHEAVMLSEVEVHRVYRAQGAIRALKDICDAPEQAAKDVERISAELRSIEESLASVSGGLDRRENIG